MVHRFIPFPYSYWTHGNVFPVYGAHMEIFFLVLVHTWEPLPYSWCTVWNRFPVHGAPMECFPNFWCTHGNCFPVLDAHMYTNFTLFLEQFLLAITESMSISLGCVSDCSSLWTWTEGMFFLFASHLSLFISIFLSRLLSRHWALMVSSLLWYYWDKLGLVCFSCYGYPEGSFCWVQESESSRPIKDFDTWLSISMWILKSPEIITGILHNKCSRIT